MAFSGITERYQAGFNCRPRKTFELLFVNAGRVGTLRRGPDGGRVDAQGNLLLRQPLGDAFSRPGEHAMSGDLVLRGKMSESGAGGELIQALSGSTRGCKGAFTAIKKDVAATIKRNRENSERPVSLRWAGTELGSARLWSRPFRGSPQSWMVLEGGLGEGCQGYWRSRGEAPTEGQWTRYCGGRLWVEGVWTVEDGTWQARGKDSLGRPVSFKEKG
ncbi:hypothetical protein [Motiliproteus sp. SC1-56]|uniref:hypothetical protein n=1 Tax=Motiliproteus sp. SC1-56 TaxID=2799565 RepID=UPI001A8C4117|nr:hypothetical protein [Motiliproteus sp. SC1-56]